MAHRQGPLLLHRASRLRASLKLALFKHFGNTVARRAAEQPYGAAVHATRHSFPLRLVTTLGYNISERQMTQGYLPSQDKRDRCTRKPDRAIGTRLLQGRVNQGSLAVTGSAMPGEENVKSLRPKLSWSDPPIRCATYLWDGVMRDVQPIWILVK